MDEPSAADWQLRPVARIRSDFGSKFGVPRQAGLVPELRARVIFEPEFRDPDALRSLDGFSHIWLLWIFDQNPPGSADWDPMVRPPRLGGNERVGVFASRSPYRPNSIGLSAVELLAVEEMPGLGMTLLVGGADLVDGTTIIDIKPYLPGDQIHDARFGYASAPAGRGLEVFIPEEFASCFSDDQLKALRGVLAQDPRPAYQSDPQRCYGFEFAGREVRFRVAGERLTVLSVS